MAETAQSKQALGAYVLPGRASDPALAIDQALAGEEIGLSSVWLSERLGVKDVATLGGALAQATSRITVGTAATHVQTRHPMALASMALTLQALTGGRFVLGIGRSIPQTWKAYGLPPASNAVLVDSLTILRKLWNGETVSYEGPAGRFPSLRFVDRPDVEPPPVILTAIGPRSLRLAGEHFDGVLLHPFLTPQAQARSADAVRRAAADAGRDPDAVRVYGMVVVAADLPEEEADIRVRARAVTYFNAPLLAKSLVEANGWDAGHLDEMARHPLIAALQTATADGALDVDQLVEVSRVLPDEWFDTGAIVGSTARCAERLQEYLDAGADEMIVHGSTPDMLAPLVEAVARLERSRA